MSHKHTNGPWSTAVWSSARGGVEIVDRHDDTVCRLTITDEHDESNARLIIAAPMLLALLQRLNDGEEITKSELRNAIGQANGDTGGISPAEQSTNSAGLIARQKGKE